MLFDRAKRDDNSPHHPSECVPSCRTSHHAGYRNLQQELHQQFDEQTSCNSLLASDYASWSNSMRPSSYVQQHNELDEFPILDHETNHRKTFHS